MEYKTTELLLALREQLETLTDEERVDVLETLFAGWCKHCGSKRLPCYCTRDD